MDIKLNNKITTGTKNLNMKVPCHLSKPNQEHTG